MYIYRPIIWQNIPPQTLSATDGQDNQGGGDQLTSRKANKLPLAVLLV